MISVHRTSHILRLRLSQTEWVAGCYRNRWPDGSGKLKDSYIIDVSMPAYKCRRTLMVPLGTSFEKLAKSVLSAFSFSYQHLYHFVYEDCYGDIYKVADPHLKPRYNDYADDTSLKDLQPAPGDQFRFLYDLNDPWEFILDIKDGLDEQADTITVINRKGEAPREV